MGALELRRVASEGVGKANEKYIIDKNKPSSQYDSSLPLDLNSLHTAENLLSAPSSSKSPGDFAFSRKLY